MPSFIVPLIATLGAIASGWVAVSHLVRIVRKGKPWILDWAAITTPLYGGLCAICLTVSGLVGILQGVLIVVLLLGTAAFMVGDSWLKIRKLPDGQPGRRILAGLRHQAWGGQQYIRHDAQFIAGLFRRDPEPDSSGQATVPGGARTRRDVPAPRAADTAASVPPVREDPRLPDVGPPEHIAGNLAAAGVGVPPAWAALAEMVGTFEPDTEEDLSASLAGDAAGVLALSEAYRARADNLLHAIGLDPASVAGHLNVADEISGLSQAFALIHHQYRVVYGELSDAVANGLMLPHLTRKWFGDAAGGTEAAEGTEDEAAA